MHTERAKAARRKLAAEAMRWQAADQKLRAGRRLIRSYALAGG
jgi:hypothetical protein